MRMNTNNESSELVIRNLKVSDSGVYKLIANNTNEKKEINITLLVEGNLFTKTYFISSKIVKTYQFDNYIYHNRLLAVI